MSSPRVWFLTGCSSGIGFSFTKTVLSKGDLVVATCRRPEVLKSLASEYSSDKLLLLPLDITQPASIKAAFAAALQKFGRIDVVVNNAGTTVVGEAEATPEEAARKVFEVNFFGMANVTREAIHVFRDINKPMGGKILTISSEAGVEGWETLTYYCGSKAAIIGFNDALVNELQPEWNIHIVVCPLGAFQSRSLKDAWKLPQHPAYADPNTAASKMRAVIETDDVVMVGDPDKATGMFYKLLTECEGKDLPRLFPMGKDCVAVFKKRSERLAEYVDKWGWMSDKINLADD